MNEADRIELRGIRARGRHGVFAAEREAGQEFVVDVTLHTDVSDAAAADDLALTIDYGAVAVDVVAVIEGDPADLIETVAERIARAVLGHPRVDAVEVTVHKPEAPIPVPFDDVAVRIVRRAAGEARP